MKRILSTLAIFLAVVFLYIAPVDALNRALRVLEIDYTTAPVNLDLPIYSTTDNEWNPGSLSSILDDDLDAIAALTGTGVACRTASDTWALRTLTAPAAGFTITNPAGVAGNPTFVLADDLAGLEAVVGNGFAARTTTNTWAARTLTAPAAGLTIANPSGIAGEPTFALANDLAALEALGSTGIGVRTTTDTWAQRTLQAPAAGFTVTNPAGVAGDPTFVLANDLAAFETLDATAGFLAKTGAETYARRTLTGTTNQVAITNGSGGGNPVFSTPQDIHTGATPTFDELRLGNASADIRGTATTQIISVYGGSTSGGGGVDFYGSGHASLPGRVDLFSGSAAGSLNINARAGNLTFVSSAGDGWLLNSTKFGPDTDLGSDLGASGTRIDNGYIKTIHSGASATTITNSTGDDMYLNTSGLISIPRGDLEFTNNGDMLVYHGDTDRSLTFRGGSTSSAGYLQVYGQSHATLPGKVELFSGANGIQLRTKSASAIALDINSANTWNVATDGDFDPSADNTRSIGSATNRVVRIGALNIDSGASTLTFENTGTDRFQMDSSGNLTVLTGTFRSSRTTDFGWTVVDGTDDTACTSQCTSAAVFGFNVVAGVYTAMVGPSDTTADICLCAGAS